MHVGERCRRQGLARIIVGTVCERCLPWGCSLVLPSDAPYFAFSFSPSMLGRHEQRFAPVYPIGRRADRNCSSELRGGGRGGHFLCLIGVLICALVVRNSWCHSTLDLGDQERPGYSDIGGRLERRTRLPPSPFHPTSHSTVHNAHVGDRTRRNEEERSARSPQLAPSHSPGARITNPTQPEYRSSA
jgi:hypothetical protein